jgi:Flp pilus assembly protein TadD
MDKIAGLEKLLGTSRDGALLRFGLGSEHARAGDALRAIEHLEKAVEFDPEYSAAWKLLGSTLSQAGRTGEALTAWQRGAEVAAKRGDKQAAKEMAVFARRLEKRK